MFEIEITPESLVRYTVLGITGTFVEYTGEDNEFVVFLDQDGEEYEVPAIEIELLFKV